MISACYVITAFVSTVRVFSLSLVNVVAWKISARCYVFDFIVLGSTNDTKSAKVRPMIHCGMSVA